MRKIFSFLIGLALGAAFGAVLVMLFSPVSGQQLVTAFKERYHEALAAGREAAAARRAELEAELESLQSA